MSSYRDPDTNELMYVDDATGKVTPSSQMYDGKLIYGTAGQPRTQIGADPDTGEPIFEPLPAGMSYANPTLISNPGYAAGKYGVSMDKTTYDPKFGYLAPSGLVDPWMSAIRGVQMQGINGGNMFENWLDSGGAVKALMSVVGGMGVADLMGGAAGATGATSALPESYWSMLAENGAAGVPGAAIPATTAATPGIWDTLSNWTTNLFSPSSLAGTAATAGISQALQGGSGGSDLNSGYSTSSGDSTWDQQFANDYLSGTSPSETPGGMPWDQSLADAQFDAAGNPIGSGLNLADIAKALGKNGLTSLLGSGIQGLSSLLASKAQQSAGQNANNTLWSMYQQNRADQAPYMAAGYGALGRLTDLTTPGNQFTAMQADPGYQWRLDQGQKALDNRLRAGGKFYSGAAMRGGQDYAQNFASNEFGNVFNRNAALAGIGQTATSNTSTLGQDTSKQLAAVQQGLGNVRGSGYMGLGNAVQTGLNNYNSANANDALMNIFNQYISKMG